MKERSCMGFQLPSCAQTEDRKVTEGQTYELLNKESTGHSAELAQGIAKEFQDEEAQTEKAEGCCKACMRRKSVQIGCGVLGTVMVIAVAAFVICTLGGVRNRITEAFIITELGGSPIFAAWSLPAQQDVSRLKHLRDQLTNTSTRNSHTFGMAGAAQAARIMYEGTKVTGVFEQVPEKMRGVFWMKGNGVGEELAVLQYGKYFADEKIYLVPFAPFMWSWAAGVPAEAPFGGALYDPKVVEASADFLIGSGKPGVAFAFIFDECPAGRDCTAGSTNLTFAHLQPHLKGDLKEMSLGLNQFVPGSAPYLNLGASTYELEEIPDSQQPGSLWTRRIWFGAGNCQCVEFGSYTLMKVIDANGQPLHPYYEEYLDYMGNAPLFLWSGFAEGQAPGW